MPRSIVRTSTLLPALARPDDDFFGGNVCKGNGAAGFSDRFLVSKGFSSFV